MAFMTLHRGGLSMLNIVLSFILFNSPLSVDVYLVSDSAGIKEQDITLNYNWRF